MTQPEKIKTATSHIWMDEEGILRLTIGEGMKVDVAEVKNCYEIIRRLTGGKKVLELMEIGSFAPFDKPAQAYAAKHGPELFLASAVIIRSPGMVILYNFFKNFFRSEVPFQMFTNEKAALAWLRKFRQP